MADRRTGMCNMTLGQTQMSDGFFAQSVPYFEKALVPFVDDTDTDRSYRVKVHTLLVTSFEETEKPARATKHLLAIGKDTQDLPEGEIRPIYRVAADYPEQLRAQGIGGLVTLQLTVDEEGFVEDVVVVESVAAESGQPPKGPGLKSFDRQAVLAVKRYRYAPRYSAGKPKKTVGVTTTVAFGAGR